MNRRSSILPLMVSVVSRGFAAVSQLVLFWCLFRQLSKHDAGYFSVFYNSFVILAPLMLLGTHQFGMRTLSEFDGRGTETSQAARGLLSMSLRTVICFVGLLVPLAYLGQLMIPQFVAGFSEQAGESGTVMANQLPWLVGASAFGAISLAVASHLHGLRQLARSIFFSHIAVPFATIVLLWYFGGDSTHDAVRCFFAATVISATAAVVTWLVTFRQVGHSAEVSAQSAGQVAGGNSRWRSSLDFAAMNLCMLLMNWAPVIIAGFLLLPDRVAELHIAQRSANVTNFLLIVVGFTFAPQFRNAWAKDDVARFRNLVTQCSRLLIGVGTPIGIAVVLLSPNIMGLFGEDYRSAWLLLVILGIGQYLNLVTGTVNQILVMCGLEKTLRNITFYACLFAIVATIVLSLWFGVVGAAVAIAMAVALQNVVAVLAVHRKLGFWVFSVFPIAEAEPQGQVDTAEQSLA
ncbi:hypothetical protein FYK55_24570 [Roseiconus nitratireducens]|uniref:O-antigen/teichoic acid export membrane protein n=1 Tax=Roseiconus nitratireducens TaxID=2605748 RepID=A0A5M6CXZ8_9BACT|nr:hypothetical protein [Roseiconus nitratireducens]KAA5539290.1 hypothetical protein FYK55_24570 [Roseiconus nitratireducens]